MVERLLIDVSHYLSRYKTTTANQDIMENIDNIFAISFTHFTAVNLYYDSFGKLVKSSLLFLPSDKPEDHAFSTNYRRYGKLVAAGSCVIGDGSIYKNVSNSDNEDDKGAGDDNNGKEKDDNQRKRDDGGVKDSDGGVEEEDSWEKSKDKESDEDHSKFGYLGILDKPPVLDTL